MAFLIDENERQARELEKKNIMKQSPQMTVRKVTEKIQEKVDVTIHFLILWTAVSMYYFFTGLSLVIHGKLPRGWKHFDRKQLTQIITNINEFTQKRKEAVKYGRVVTLDYVPPKINLLK